MFNAAVVLRRRLLALGEQELFEFLLNGRKTVHENKYALVLITFWSVTKGGHKVIENGKTSFYNSFIHVFRHFLAYPSINNISLDHLLKL